MSIWRQKIKVYIGYQARACLKKTLACIKFSFLPPLDISYKQE